MHIPGAEAPFIFWVLERAKPEGLAYLEALGIEDAALDASCEPTHFALRHEWVPVWASRCESAAVGEMRGFLGCGPLGLRSE
jgi:hypothetical protein